MMNLFIRGQSEMSIFVTSDKNSDYVLTLLDLLVESIVLVREY